jgi:hypothetical protein
MSVRNQERLETFRRNADVVKGIKVLGAMDSHEPLACIAYSGSMWDLDGQPINGTTLPFNDGLPHDPKCRCVYVAVTKTFREIGIDIDEPRVGTRASDEGPIPADITFDEFLVRKNAAYVNALLGFERAELWRQGTIRCRDLVDNDGQVLSIEALLCRYGDV